MSNTMALKGLRGVHYSIKNERLVIPV